MKTALIASLVASATAFAPASQSGRTSMALNLDITKEIGVQVRFNTTFFLSFTSASFNYID